VLALRLIARELDRVAGTSQTCDHPVDLDPRELAAILDRSPPNGVDLEV
jgi:hypothetical protein